MRLKRSANRQTLDQLLAGRGGSAVGSFHVFFARSVRHTGLVFQLTGNAVTFADRRFAAACKSCRHGKGGEN